LFDVRGDEAIGYVGGMGMRRLQGEEGSRSVNAKPI
jgi:hypothetical protein